MDPTLQPIRDLQEDITHLRKTATEQIQTYKNKILQKKIKLLNKTKCLTTVHLDDFQVPVVKDPFEHHNPNDYRSHERTMKEQIRMFVVVTSKKNCPISQKIDVL